MSYPRFIGRVENEIVVLEDEEFHHAVRVRRVKEGYKIEINDLRGNVYLAEVERIEKKRLIAKILEKIPVEEEEIKITLYQCMPNHLSKIDDLIEPISELGVYKLVPVISKNTAVKERDIQKKINKWKKIAINSIKQCKRLYPLEIDNPVKLKDIHPNEKLKVLFYEREREKTLKEIKLNKSLKTAAVVIGAEGGFEEEEVLILKEKGFETFSLGKNILRMETSVIVGICQVKFVLT